MEGARELLLCFEMTAVTELRLLFLHQKLAFFGVMWRVAIGAPSVVLQVRRAAKICVLFAILMAIQAAGTRFLCRNVLEGKNLTFVSAPIDVTVIEDFSRGRYPDRFASIREKEGAHVLPIRPQVSLALDHSSSVTAHVVYSTVRQRFTAGRG